MSGELGRRGSGLLIAGGVDRFGLLFGCDNVTTSLPNTDNYYARFTSTVLCSKLIQESRTDCSLTDETATPLCAEVCVRSGSRDLVRVPRLMIRAGPVREE